MNNEIIKEELRNIQKKIFVYNNNNISEEDAFEYLALQFFCYKTNDIDEKIFDIKNSITNGSNDGGIDFVFYDEEELKVILGQCKYTENMNLNAIVSELNKMSSTVENFKKGLTGSYNQKLKNILQNALDRLTEENVGNVEYWIFTTSSFNENEVDNKIEKEHNLYSKEMVSIFGLEDISSKIKETIEKNNTVSEFKLQLDKANNVLSYTSDKISGIMVNISSSSLVRMYNKYKDDGLFDLNLRKYIRNKTVDEGIKNTLDKDRDNFWFYNNGLTIACEDFILDGNTLKLYNFSIINGGQTTNRIGNYKGSNSQEFYIPCKVIRIKNNNLKMYAKITEATNSQKPINARDLKSNSPEMKMLQNWLKNEGVYLEVKRGEKRKQQLRTIKNDVLGQLILSFAHQQPGTARSGKKNIFENNSLYNKLYKVNYEKDANKKAFILDLIQLNEDYSNIELELKKGSKIKDEDKVVLANGKYVIMALMGLSYLIANEDYNRDELNNDVNLIKDPNFVFGSFISNYKNDDYKEKLESLIRMILDSLCDTYDSCIRNGIATSVSNLFKTEKKYRDYVVMDFLKMIDMRKYKDEFKDCCEILKR
ncbi:AIPR family protein [Thomasclavelia spiroformis]|uniref:AIPR family protein n=1 Tax=Thomasclavelia spiroformis TaxID=29348 RepID=UPI0029431AE0|nr:AIPR family protein [Thomasclavelia spiroformis]